jgi:hypothetical protein
MLVTIIVTLVAQVMGMAMQVCFYAAAAYWVAKMAHKGWRAGK